MIPTQSTSVRNTVSAHINKYIMDISVVAASGIREFFHVPGFEFESEALDRRVVCKQGQEKFISSLKDCVIRNPVVAQRLGRLRYKIRTSRIRAI
jgi:hypothetical protein